MPSRRREIGKGFMADPHQVIRYLPRGSATAANPDQKIDPEGAKQMAKVTRASRSPRLSYLAGGKWKE